MPTTEFIPKMEIGKLRCLSPFQMSVIVLPTILMATELAPPKKRVAMIAEKLGAVADGISQTRKKMYEACEYVSEGSLD